jgi:hypothetical protein
MDSLRDDLRDYIDSIATLIDTNIDAQPTPPGRAEGHRRRRPLVLTLIAACVVLAGVLAVVAATTVGGSGNTRGSSSSASCGNGCATTPRASVHTFYEAARRGDLPLAARVTARSQRATLASSENPDFGNLRCAVPAFRRNGTVSPNSCRLGALTSIQILQVQEASLPTRFVNPTTDMWRRVRVTFKAIYRAQSALSDGRQTRELVVGRDRTTQHWLIYSAVVVATPAETSAFVPCNVQPRSTFVGDNGLWFGPIANLDPAGGIVTPEAFAAMPDYVAVTCQDGTLAGYAKKTDLFGAGSQPILNGGVVDVYADDGTTLVGHFGGGNGFSSLTGTPSVAPITPPATSTATP